MGEFLGRRDPINGWLRLFKKALVVLCSAEILDYGAVKAMQVQRTTLLWVNLDGNLCYQLNLLFLHMSLSPSHHLSDSRLQYM